MWVGICDDYPPYVTPLMLACEKNSFPAVKILLHYGHRLHKPHLPDCTCPECEMMEDVSLIEAKTRYTEFKCLASPPYVILSTFDPLLYMFRLNSVLKAESKTEPEFYDEYTAIANHFCMQLLNQCRTKVEVMILLSRQVEFPMRTTPMPFNRVHQALELDLYTFVTNVNCQQVWGFPYFKIKIL
ncbi:hypothetical protein HELRODRAFT_89480 [Helobdella robusta]|uniref:Transient receptor ion channel domain-containing protein n=1 Tax=Helobdella robusta TaxID=6412 RepID=T1G7D3_HELRO|nr:hypothetical protein HELRODRAFT_89480 [Helobdella robusta]ESN92393.1 hypothetical protein HELRODRAFT_89480 [Helobdella robusta]